MSTIRKAIDLNQEIVWIDQAERNHPYYCEICGQELIAKKGCIRIHHFAHKGSQGNHECSDNWNYDMSEWHKSWQELFPLDNREMVVKLNGEAHRADVLINHTVIEFQHSSISQADFEKRNRFYLKNGYQIIWVFDISEQWRNDEIIEDNKNTNYYSFKRSHFFFDVIKEHMNQVTVYLHFDNSFDRKEFTLERIKKLYYNTFSTFEAISINDFIKKVSGSNQPVLYRKEYSITELWKNDYQYMIIENIRDGQNILIRRGDMKTAYNGKVKGQYRKKDSSGNYYSIPIKYTFDLNEKKYKCVCCES